MITANDKGFKQADKRDIVLILNGIDNKPKIIEANQKKIRYVKNKEFDSIKNTFGWTWNEANKECRIKITDTRINYSITIN